MEWNNKSEVRQHFIMALCGGFFGGYAIFGRSAVFGSAQTANLIELVSDLLGRDFREVLLRLGALLLYISAMVLFAVLSRKTVWNLKYLVFLIETGAVVLLAVLPENLNPIVALYPVFFAASFQWCVFKGAEGYACSTIFSTNNVKQTVLSFCDYFLTGQEQAQEREKSLKKGRFFGETLLFFHTGVACAFLGLKALGLSAIWLNLLVILAGLCATEALEGRIRAQLGGLRLNGPV